MYSKLTQVIDQSGMWHGDRKESHKFLLSPSIYRITEMQRSELAELGYSLKECLSGFSHMAAIAHDKSLNYTHGAWFLARCAFTTGVPKIYHDLYRLNIKDVPQLLKIDLMSDQEGKFKIAEIDGHNKHGLGYSTLALRFRQALYSKTSTLPGTVKMLADRLKLSSCLELKLFFGDQERFYIPEFEVAIQEFAKHDINCILMPEMFVNKTSLQNGMFLDLPFLYRKKELYEPIISAYRAGEVKFIIPPKPFFGAKGLLALIRNDTDDQSLEALLRTFIKGRSLEIVRRFIPKTLLIGKQAMGFKSAQTHISLKKWVLKRSISSGMKGVFFSDESNFNSLLSKACDTSMDYILQEEVVNQPQTFSWFHENGGDNEPELMTSPDWFMRATVQYVCGQLADIIITARRDKAVHGAKDCIQIGTIVM